MVTNRKKNDGPMILDPTEIDRNLANKARMLIEQQIDDGTVSPSVLVTVLKSDNENTRRTNELLEAKIKQLTKETGSEDLAGAAVDALTNYKPDEPEA